MSYRKPPEKTKWKPGQSGNPQGARLHDPERKALKRLTVGEFQDLIKATLDHDVEALRKLTKNGKISALKMGIANALIKAIDKGDWKVLEAMIARLIGHVPQKHDHTTAGAPITTAVPTQVVLYLPKNGSTKEENGNEDDWDFT